MRHRDLLQQSPDARRAIGVYDRVCAQDRAAGGVLDDVVVLHVAVELIVAADAEAELLVLREALGDLALTPVEEVRRLVLDIATAHAPLQEGKQVLDDRTRVAVAVPVDRERTRRRFVALRLASPAVTLAVRYAIQSRLRSGKAFEGPPISCALCRGSAQAVTARYDMRPARQSVVVRGDHAGTENGRAALPKHSWGRGMTPSPRTSTTEARNGQIVGRDRRNL